MIFNGKCRYCDGTFTNVLFTSLLTLSWVEKHIQKAAAVYPVTCSEGGACLTDFRLQILGANDPWSENFRKCLSGFLDGTPDYVSWPNLVKIGRCEVAERSSGLPHKKLRLRETRPSPHFTQNGPIVPKIPWTLSPLDIPNLVMIGCVLPDLFRKDWFFGPKSQ